MPMTQKLLLADDSVTIQRVIELTFADEDVQVLAVGDGKQAIERVQSDRPDIVLADTGMPERDGYEVAAFIKSNPELAHIPVLLLTGAFEPIDEARARAVGCDGVLVKPFEPQMVISRVRDLLTGRGASTSMPPSAPADIPQPAAAPPSGAGARAPVQQPPAVGAGSLEEYFDRLDAAFASLNSPASAPAPQVNPWPPPDLQSSSPAPVAPDVGAPLDVLGGWDPDLTGDPVRPLPPMAPREPMRSVTEPPTPPVSPPPMASTAALPPEGESHKFGGIARASTAVSPMAAPPTPPVSIDPLPESLPDAFAALLAAEQGEAVPFVFQHPPAPSVPVSDEMIDEIVRRVIARMGDDSMRNAVLETAEKLVREEIERIKRQSR